MKTKGLFWEFNNNPYPTKDEIIRMVEMKIIKPVEARKMMFRTNYYPMFVPKDAEVIGVTPEELKNGL